MKYTKIKHSEHQKYSENHNSFDRIKAYPSQFKKQMLNPGFTYNIDTDGSGNRRN